MLKKIEDRLNKEIEKIISKDELSISDYFFLESLAWRLKNEQKINVSQDSTSELLNKALDFLKLSKEGDKTECSKEI